VRRETIFTVAAGEKRRKEEIERVARGDSLFIIAEAGGIGAHNGRGNRLDKDHCFDLRT